MDRSGCDTVQLAPSRIKVWHDRAVFHFLTEEADRDRYVAQVRHAVAPGGHVIIATFGPEGPLRCSGLPTSRMPLMRCTRYSY